MQSMKMSAATHRHADSRGIPRPVVAVLGGTGRFGRPYIREFLAQGLDVRILARAHRRVARRFPSALVMGGSMMEPAAVTRLFQGAAAAFLITPVGANDDTNIELRAARTAVTAAKSTQLPHLIYLSLLQPLRPTGVPMLDVKGQIESLAMSSGVPFSSLRTGCYMDIWLAFFPLCMRLGLYLFPIAAGHRFSFTSQRDVARVAAALIRRHKVLNGPVDIIDPLPHSLEDVLRLYRAATGRKLIPLGRWLLPLLKLLRPTVFRWLYPCGASRVPLFSHFNQNDWVGNPRQLSELLPEFQITTMQEHCRCLAS